MTTSSASDVERVLSNVGTPAFRYRQFRTEPDALPQTLHPTLVTLRPPAPETQDGTAQGSAATVFALLGAALPEAKAVSVSEGRLDPVPAPSPSSPVSVAPPLAAPPLPPMVAPPLPPMPAAPPMAMPTPPFPPRAPANPASTGVRPTALTALFRTLSAAKPAQTHTPDRDPAIRFPFRRS